MAVLVEVDSVKLVVETFENYGFFVSKNLTKCFGDLLSALNSDLVEFEVFVSMTKIPEVKYKTYVGISLKANGVAVEYGSVGDMNQNDDQEFCMDMTFNEMNPVLDLFEKNEISVEYAYDRIEIEKFGADYKCFISSAGHRDHLKLRKINKTSSSSTLFKAFDEIEEKVF